ncbi:MAG: GAF domain-containing protein [Pseudomonadota bacterium]
MDRNLDDFDCVPEFDALAESIVARLGCDLALISVARGEAFVSLGHSAAPEDSSDRLSEIRKTLCGLAYLQRKVVCLPDVSAASEADLDDVQPSRTAGAYIGVPLWREDDLTGVLCALSTMPRAWSASELQYMTCLADLVESKIDRTILRYEQRALSAALAENDAVLAALSGARSGACTVQNANGELVFASSALETDLGLGTRAVMTLPALARSVAVSGRDEATLKVDLLDHPNLTLHVRTHMTTDGLILSDWSTTGACGDITRAG